MPHPDYPVLIEPLPAEDGGGYLATVPDLPGCMSYQTPYPVTAVEHTRMPGLHHPAHLGESSHQIGRLVSDGETHELAARNVGDAIATWIEEAQALGRAVPTPSQHSVSALS